jgi:hypothetical protein
MPSSCIVVANLLVSIQAFAFVNLLYEKFLPMSRKSMIKPKIRGSLFKLVVDHTSNKRRGREMVEKRSDRL